MVDSVYDSHLLVSVASDSIVNEETSTLEVSGESTSQVNDVIISDPLDLPRLIEKEDDMELDRSSPTAESESVDLVAKTSGPIVLAEKVHPAVTKKRIFHCFHCGATRYKKNRLRRHIFLHTGYRPYSCEICNNFSCIRHKNYERHMRYHTGERPFLCATCGRTFKELWHMKEHDLRVHQKVPYSCRDCDYTASNHYALRRHVKHHIKQKKNQKRRQKKREKRESLEKAQNIANLTSTPEISKTVSSTRTTTCLEKITDINQHSLYQVDIDSQQPSRITCTGDAQVQQPNLTSIVDDPQQANSIE